MGIVFRDWETRLVARKRLVQTDLRYIELAISKITILRCVSLRAAAHRNIAETGHFLR